MLRDVNERLNQPLSTDHNRPLADMIDIIPSSATETQDADRFVTPTRPDWDPNRRSFHHRLDALAAVPPRL